ncbi:MAG: MnhB domain-containing protein [Candidatus Brocadiia bacterium]
MRDRSLVVETVCRWIAPFILLYGVYVVAFGHLSPGGGFPGGVVLASAFILMVLAWGKDKATRHLPFHLAEGLDSLGALLFLGLGLAGLAGGWMLTNFVHQTTPGGRFRLFSAGTIPLANIAIALKVCASLFLVMVVLSVLRVKAGGTNEDLRTQQEV